MTQLETIDDELCSELDKAGVRAVRFNVARGVLAVANCNQSRSCRDLNGAQKLTSALTESTAVDVDATVDIKAHHDPEGVSSPPSAGTASFT